MNKTDEQNELLAAFALDSLDESEARALTALIAADAEFASEFEMWRDVAAEMALLAPLAEPAPAVRQSILAAIRKTPQNSNSGQKSAAHAATVTRTNETVKQPQKSSEKAVVLNFPVRAKTSFWSYAPAFGTIAASLAVVFLGISLYNAAQSNKIKSDQIAELNQKVAAAEQKINDTQAELERARQERELLASPATFVKALDGTKEVPTAKARLVFDPKTGKALLYVEGLPAAPEGKAYQIWFISDPKHIAPGKTFETGQDGKGVLRDQIPAQGLKAGIFAITLEPVGGSLVPTGSILLKTEA